MKNFCLAKEQETITEIGLSDKAINGLKVHWL